MLWQKRKEKNIYILSCRVKNSLPIYNHSTVKQPSMQLENCDILCCVTLPERSQLALTVISIIVFIGSLYNVLCVNELWFLSCEFILQSTCFYAYYAIGNCLYPFIGCPRSLQIERPNSLRSSHSFY